MAENPLKLREWLLHAYEETLDQAIYLRRAIDETPCSSPDELCVRMLSLGAMGGCEGGTNELRASEIKTLLVPFFGLMRVARCTAVLCGENSST